MLWGLWLTVYSVNNGMITWFPTLYKTWFNLSLDTSLAYGWITSSCGVVASVICALMIDRVGRKRWYTWAFLLAIVPLITLSVLGAKSAFICTRQSFTPPDCALSAPRIPAHGSGRGHPSAH